ncbi:hypothetical protein [Anabaena sp. CCY 0017]|uniref:hypothetical protein n=1 Tax=Anabaena sp. CCY 0017 TaxID=3103866 RepID=UPI0039C71E79
MKVEIQNLELSSSDKHRVQFSSALGNACAYWQGIPPQLGETYHVELSVGTPLNWGVDILQTTESTYQLKQEGDGVGMIAKLETYEEEGLAFLRLGGSILMIETLGNPAPIGTFVEAHIRELILSDTGI